MAEKSKELIAKNVSSKNKNLPPHVVILGGGFAGLYAAKSLRKAPVRITLIDQKNHHLFQPLLYQVATAALTAPDIASPIRKILKRSKNTTVLLGKAISISPHEKKVILEDGEFFFDYLIVAVGATHSYYGHPEWESYAPGLKTIEDAFEIRRRILLAFESAEKEEDPQKQKEWLTFLVIGGGPTGVELAGALAEIARHTMIRDFRRINPRDAKIILIEGVDRILPLYPKKLSEKAKEQLEDLGVKVYTNRVVTEINEKGVNIGENFTPAKTVIWSAGVIASPILQKFGVPLDRSGRVLVNSDLTIPGHYSIFVVGDAAALKQGDFWVPGIAPAAIQEGKHAAKNILLALKEKDHEPFHYSDRGLLATIGRSKGVAYLGKVKFWGFWAWILWLFVHIFFLIGFRNRFVVFFEWAWAYVTLQRSARLILTKETKSE